MVLLNNNLAQQPEWIKDSTGKITGYKTQEGGAGAVFPFSNGPYIKEMRASMSVSGGNYVKGSFTIVPNGAKKIILSSLYNASISNQVNCSVISSNQIDVTDPSIDCSFGYSAVAYGGTSPLIIGAISSFE